MNTNDISKHYGGDAEARAALDVSRQVWDYWKKVGVPINRQFEIQKSTSATGAPLLLGEQKPAEET